MAINTVRERSALISVALWRGRWLPVADGTLDLSDRLHLALLYPSEGVLPPQFKPWYAARINTTSGALIHPE